MGPGGNSFPRNGVIGATRSGSQLWVAWTAGTDSNFQQSHVEMVTLEQGNNFNKSRQVQVWNNNYAFAYSALATNACTGGVGTIDRPWGQRALQTVSSGSGAISSHTSPRAAMLARIGSATT